VSQLSPQRVAHGVACLCVYDEAGRRNALPRESIPTSDLLVVADSGLVFGGLVSSSCFLGYRGRTSVVVVAAFGPRVWLGLWGWPCGL